MIKFYTGDQGVVQFRDDSYQASAFFTIDRPATADDIAAHPEAFAALNAPVGIDIVAGDTTLVAVPVEPVADVPDASTVTPDVVPPAVA
jgi:hypothetical protein